MASLYLDWNAIVKYYETNRKLEPMLELSRYLLSSSYRFRLRGFIFLDTLILSAYEDFNLFCNCLHISFDEELREFVFLCYDEETVDHEPSRQKKFNANKGIEGFVDTISKVKWY